MSVPLQVRTLYAIYSRLTEIDAAGMYLTDAGDRVLSGPIAADDLRDGLPLLVISDGGDAPVDGDQANGSSASIKMDQTILIDAYADPDDWAASALRADVKRAVFRRDQMVLKDDDGPIGLSLSYGGAEPIDAPAGANAAGFRLTVRVRLMEGYGVPDAPR